MDLHSQNERKKREKKQISKQVFLIKDFIESSNE